MPAWKTSCRTAIHPYFRIAIPSFRFLIFSFGILGFIAVRVPTMLLEVTQNLKIKIYFPTVHSILTNNLGMTCLQTDITEADTLAQLFQWGISSDSV